MGEEEVSAYLEHLAIFRRVSPSTQKIHYTGINLFVNQPIETSVDTCADITMAPLQILGSPFLKGNAARRV